MGNTLLDPSIISGAMNQIAQNTGPQQMQGWLAARNAMLQNQALQSKQAAGQDFQKAINPLTGVVDYGKFNALLAGDKGAAFAAQDASQAGMDNQAKYQSNLQAEAQTYMDRSQAAAGLAASWMQKPGLSRSDVMDGVADMISQGILTPSAGAQVVKSFDPTNPSGWAKNEFDALTAQAGQVKALLPQYSAIDTGAATNLVNTNPLAGPPHVMGSLPNTLSPAQAAAPTQIVLPSGQTVTEPLGAYATANGIPSIPMPGNGAAPGQPGSAPAALPGGAIPGPAPGQLAMNDADTKYLTDTLAQQQAAQQGMASLRNVMAALPGANTGPAASSVAEIGAALDQLGINIGDTQATQEQNLTKNATQLIMSATGKLGVPTDAKLVTAALGSPNSQLTEGANRTIAGELMGGFAYQNAAANYLQAARAQGLTPGTTAFAKVRSQLNDPMLGTAFQYLYLDPAARARVLKVMPKQDQQQLVNSINFAYAMDANLPSLK
ncbi:MAG: hypothetical protein KGH91_03035 [Rhodospirillales bacterium]|nr:hypothetical protein [Rhodospirillales bacterium]